MAKRFVGEFEQMVLLAILQLRGGAYGPNLSQKLERRADRRISKSALYSALDRLEAKGLVEWSIEAATSTRGGNRRRLFTVTEKGIAALTVSRRALLNLWDGLEELLGGSAT